MPSSARLLLGLLLTAGVCGPGCSSSALCDIDTSIECYCEENPENCASEPEAITSSAPDTIVNE